MICGSYYNYGVGFWKCDIFGISLLFVLFFLCVDVDGVNDEAKLVNDKNKKRLLCESKYHFLILCVIRRLMFSLFLFVL